MRAFFGETLLDVRHLSGAPKETYTIGESHEATLVVPPHGLPNGGDFALVRGRTLRFTPSMRGDLTREGSTSTLQAWATTRGSSSAFVLMPGDRCTVLHQGLTFVVRVVPQGEPQRLDAQYSRPVWTWTLRCLLVFLVALIPVYVSTAPDSGVGEHPIDLSRQPTDIATFASPAAPTEPEPTEPGDEGTTDGEDSDTVSAPAEPEDEQSGRGLSIEGDGGGPGDAFVTDAELLPVGEPGEEGFEGLLLGHAGGSSRAWLSSNRTRRRARLRTALPCHALDLLAIEAPRYTHTSLITFLGRCEAPNPGGIPQMARNFDPDVAARNAGLLSSLQREPETFLADPGLHHHHDAELQSLLRRRPPRVRLAKARVKGPLDRDIVRRIVRAHINEVYRCYALGLGRRPRLRGRVAVDFTIGPDGRVSKVKISRSSLGDKRVERCIAAAVRRWQFPKPRGGAEVRVTFPFVLDRHSAADQPQGLMRTSSG